MTRQEANIHILKFLITEVGNHPDQRFNQILSNLRILVSKEVVDARGEYATMYWEDRYYEESEATLNRVLGE